MLRKHSPVTLKNIFETCTRVQCVAIEFKCPFVASKVKILNGNYDEKSSRTLPPPPVSNRNMRNEKKGML